MLKICGDSVYEPLEIIFRQALLTGVFPSEWKKGNIVPVHKKSDKQDIKNYRPISLLPICGKIFERLIFNKMFKNILSLIILFHQTSRDSKLEIHVSTNYYQLPTKFTNHLMTG